MATEESNSLYSWLQAILGQKNYGKGDITSMNREDKADKKMERRGQSEKTLGADAFKKDFV